MTPRPYQQAAMESLDAALRDRTDNPCIEIPTGGGKTPTMAFVIAHYMESYPQLRVLVLAHVKELLEQGVEKMRCIAPQMPIGVYSASLGRKQHNAAVTYAGIQSIWKKAKDAQPWDLIFVDEAHRIPIKSEGMYRRFLDDARQRCAHQRVVGWTATPYRLDGGPICTEQNMLNHICYRVSVQQLIDDGYLCRLTAKCGANAISREGLHTVSGDFVTSELEQRAQQHLEETVIEVVSRTADRKAVLIFGISVAHIEQIQAIFREKHGIDVPIVSANTPMFDRNRIVNQFRSGQVKYLLNVNVFSEGFDVPTVDCVVMLRPTKSAGMYYQQVGRGLRIAEGKPNCMILDFAGNIMTHGPIDLIQPRDPAKRTVSDPRPPMKVCPACQSIIAIGLMECPDCGHVWEVMPAEANHESKPADAAILSSELADDGVYVVAVQKMLFDIYCSRQTGKEMLVVEYEEKNEDGQGFKFKEFLQFEASGIPGMRARMWWRERFSAHPVPKNSSEAFSALHAGDASLIIQLFPKLTIRKDGKYWRIVSYHKRKESANVQPGDSTFDGDGVVDDSNSAGRESATAEELARTADIPF